MTTISPETKNFIELDLTQGNRNLVSLMYEMMGEGEDVSLEELKKAIDAKREEGQVIDWPTITLKETLEEMRGAGIIDEENGAYFFLVNGKRMKKAV